MLECLASAWRGRVALRQALYLARAEWLPEMTAATIRRAILVGVVGALAWDLANVARHADEAYYGGIVGIITNPHTGFLASAVAIVTIGAVAWVLAGTANAKT